MSDERYKDENPDEFVDKMNEILKQTQENELNSEPSDLASAEEASIQQNLFSQEVNEDSANDSSVKSENSFEESSSIPLAEDISEGIDNVLDKTEEVLENAGETIKEGAEAGLNKAAEIGDSMVSGAAVVVGAIGAGLGLASKKEEQTSLVDQDVPSVLRPDQIFKEEIEEDNRKLEEANNTIANILSRLKEKNFNNDYGILGYLVSFPLVLAVVWQFIQKGLTIRVGIIVLLIIFYLIYRALIKGNARTVLELKRKIQANQGEENSKKGLFSKIDYVISGIDLNVQRIAFTKWLYIVFTPFLFHFGREIWKGDLEGGTTFWLLMLTFVLSAVFWPLVFNRDIKALRSLETELYDLRGSFNS